MRAVIVRLTTDFSIHNIQDHIAWAISCRADKPD